MLKKSVVMFIGVLFSSSLYANVQYNISGGQLTGVNHVNVNGLLYNVNFVNGSFDSIFNNASGLDFTTASDAQAASTALMNVITDTSGFNVDSNPTLMNGCSDLTQPCYVFTPYSLAFSNYVSISIFTNASVDASDIVWNALYDRTTDVTFATDDVYANWSLASVSEPGTLLLMSIGFLGIAAFRRKV